MRAPTQRLRDTLCAAVALHLDTAAALGVVAVRTDVHTVEVVTTEAISRSFFVRHLSFSERSYVGNQLSWCVLVWSSWTEVRQINRNQFNEVSPSITHLKSGVRTGNEQVSCHH